MLLGPTLLGMCVHMCVHVCACICECACVGVHACDLLLRTLLVPSAFMEGTCNKQIRNFTLNEVGSEAWEGVGLKGRFLEATSCSVSGRGRVRCCIKV